MMNIFDDLIRAERDTDAIRFLAREYYENGKMGHTRKRLLERVAERYDVLEAELAKYKKAFELACAKLPAIPDELGRLEDMFLYQAAQAKAGEK